MNRDEFYVGYLPTPPGLRRTLVRIVLGLAGIFVVLALVLVVGQGRFAASAFEFHQYRDFRGVIRERPYPHLLVSRPGSSEFSRYLLVATGKHGVSAITRGLDGKQVGLRGSLIYRAGDTMIELAPGSQPLVEGVASAPESAPLDAVDVTLAGEIADSKCYFGVMNPGEGKVHRDCAVRCISGGIPPVFIARDAQKSAKTLVLVGADGRQLNREALDFVAEPIRVKGQLVRSGETLILLVEPASFVRESRR
jgi:hypothetical protein